MPLNRAVFPLLLGLGALFPVNAEGQTPLSTSTSALAAATKHSPVRAADSRARYHRLICLVPLVGSGTKTDPVRPEYVPIAADATRQGIIAWGSQLTDDKTMAIIHVVALTRAPFASILADTRPQVKVFEIGKDSRATIEAAMQLVKKGFDLSQFEVRAQ